MLALYRVIPGILFLISGFLKAMDPVGGALKIDEYLSAFHLSFLDFLAFPIAFILPCIEFILGVCLLKGINIKKLAPWAVVIMSFFTLLTLYSAIFSPVKDCGCFGEAIQISNLASFLKNVVLLSLVIMVYRNRESYRPIALPLFEKIFTATYALFIVLIAFWASLFIPQVDFTPLKIGVDLSENANSEIEREFVTTFVYSKEGEEKTFTIDNLPDSTWKYISSKTVQVSGPSADDPSAEFVLKDAAGNYLTKEILESEQPLFFISIYNGERIGERFRRKVIELRDTLASHGAGLYAVTADANLLWDIEGIQLLYSDYKTILSFNRSNGGLVYVKDEMVVAKWSRRDYPTAKVGELLKRDYEEVAADKVIGEQLFVEFALILLFVMLFVVRYLSKRHYARYLDRTKKEAVAK